VVSFNHTDESILPVVDAGNDTLTCNTLFFMTQGHAENYSSVFWTTSGDGTFIENHTVDATYLRGPGDINNNQVTLTLSITGYEPGSQAADSMILYINKDPVVNAGPDDTIGSEDVVPLQGEVNYAYYYFWTTRGDGSFTDSTALDAIYSPGPEDIINEGVNLILTANEVNPCSGRVSDSLYVQIISTGTEDIFSGRFDIHLFPNPTKDIVILKASNLHAQEMIIEILDGLGKMIFTGRFYADDYYFEKQFDLSLLSPGIYFVRLQTRKNVKTQKLILINN